MNSWSLPWIGQKELAAEGDRRLLGQTLVEMGMVTRETIDMAITNQIIELHAALTDANRTLELRVSERTSELKAALARLTELNQLKTNLISTSPMSFGRHSRISKDM